MSKKLKKYMRQRAKKYPITISDYALSQGKRLGFNLKTLLKMTEKVVYFGIWDWDAQQGSKVDHYFTKLINAFDKHILFKLSSDYVFAFNLTELAAIFPIHENIRGEAQELFLINKREWENLKTNERETRKGNNIKELSEGTPKQFSFPTPSTQREIWDAQDREEEAEALKEFRGVGNMTDEEWQAYNAEFYGS